MLERTPPSARENIENKLKNLPDHPGVYLHKNESGEIIYVGKAVSLKNRVRQYFQNSWQGSKVAAMVGHIHDFEYILTDSEVEALTLESNLIKQNMPHYNILLKDDKHFPYVRIDLKAPFPRVEVVRRLKNDGAKYIGPFLSSLALTQSLETVRATFPLRSCKKDMRRAIDRQERPCLNYHIGKCCAPCTGKVSEEEYRGIVDQVAAFLAGKTDTVLKKLREDMLNFSLNLEYERAAMLRDRIKAIEDISEKQKAISANLDERDVFAFVRSENDAIVYALFMRAGKLVGAEHFAMTSDSDDPVDAVMSSFIEQYYASAGSVPKEVLVHDLPLDLDALSLWLTQKRGNKVSIVCPQRGDKRKLCEMARKNGEDYLDKLQQTRRREWERHEGALTALSTALSLKEPPQRIEAYDISHTQGTDVVASMVVFIKGRPMPKEYRRFRIKGEWGNDDFASMRETLTRRLERAKAAIAAGEQGGWADLPDLLVIDGGKGQVSSVLSVLGELQLSLPVMGLEKRLEEIILPGRSESILLEKGSPALHLLQRVRDESHRFAITYHRSLRQKTALFSVLDEVDGIGPKRRKALYDAFPTIDMVKSASIEELKKAKGMDSRSAQAVFAHFHTDGGAAQKARDELDE